MSRMLSIRWQITSAVVLALTAFVLIFPVHAKATVGYWFYSPVDPEVSCATGHYANGAIASRGITVHAPRMDSLVPTNPVSYQAILYYSNGVSWIQSVKGPEQRGGTGLYGLFDTNFTIPANWSGHYWKVSVVYRWYSASGALLNVEHYWAGTHQSFRVLSNGQVQITSGLLAYCYLP